MARAMAGRLVQLLAEGRGGDASGKSGEAIERLAEEHDGVLGSVWRWSQRCSLAMGAGGVWRCGRGGWSSREKSARVEGRLVPGWLRPNGSEPT